MSKLYLPNIPIPLGVKQNFPPPPPGAVLYLPFYPPNLSPTPDYSGNGNAGTISGATWARRPKGLPYLTFDGNDYVVSTLTVSIIPIYSATCWAYISTVGDPLTILSFGSGSSAPDELSSRALRIRFSNSAGAWSSVSTLRVVNTWYHIALVRNNTTDWIKIYVNGTIDTDEAYVPDLTEDPVKVHVGRLYRSAAGSQFFIGNIAMVSVFNKSLSSTEVQNMFNRERHLFGV